MECVNNLLKAYVLCIRRSVGVIFCTLVFNLAFAIIGLTLFGSKGQMQHVCARNSSWAAPRPPSPGEVQAAPFSSSDDSISKLVLPPRHCMAPKELGHQLFVPLAGHRCR